MKKIMIIAALLLSGAANAQMKEKPTTEIPVGTPMTAPLSSATELQIVTAKAGICLKHQSKGPGVFDDPQCGAIVKRWREIDPDQKKK